MRLIPGDTCSSWRLCNRTSPILLWLVNIVFVFPMGCELFEVGDWVLFIFVCSLCLAQCSASINGLYMWKRSKWVAERMETDLNDRGNGTWISSGMNHKARNRQPSTRKQHASWQGHPVTSLENISTALILKAVLKTCQSREHTDF